MTLLCKRKGKIHDKDGKLILEGWKKFSNALIYAMKEALHQKLKIGKETGEKPILAKPKRENMPNPDDLQPNVQKHTHKSSTDLTGQISDKTTLAPPQTPPQEE